MSEEALCYVAFGSHGCEKRRFHDGEERIDSHVCDCGANASGFDVVFGDDAERLGLRGRDQDD